MRLSQANTIDLRAATSHDPYAARQVEWLILAVEEGEEPSTVAALAANSDLVTVLGGLDALQWLEENA